MIRTLLADKLLRTPWGFPLVVAVAAAGLVGTEVVHRNTLATMDEAGHANEVHAQANVANYNALDRVNALRSFLIDGNLRWIERYKESSAQLEQSLGVVSTFLQRTDAAGAAEAAQLKALFARRSAALDVAFEAAREGRRDDALAALRASDATGDGVNLRAALLDAVERAEASRTQVREHLRQVFNGFRWLVHLLNLAMLLGAYALMRQVQLVDATHRRQAEWLESEVARRTEQLRELAGHLITTREDERARLARELHDEMGGMLSTIKLDVARLKRASGVTDKVLEHARSIDQRVNEVVGIKRRVIENLRPSSLDHLGVTQALSVLCRENAAAMQVPTHEELQEVQLAPDLELTVYRLVQESLTNARKYSKAREIWVRLEVADEQVRVAVEDDGVGFEHGAVGSGHHGLAGMRLRVESHGGRLDVGRRADGRGTRISAVLPAKWRAHSAPPETAA